MNAKPTDISSALAIIEQSIQEIDMQYDNLKRIEQSLDKSKQAQNNKDSLNNNNQNAGGNNSNNTPKVEMVKCGYCGQSFDKLTSKSCPGCGAVPK